MVLGLDKRRVVLGSSTSCDIRIDDPSVSPIHAILEVDAAAGKATIYDLASENGTMVGGQKIIQQDLKPGDSFQLGSHIVYFRRADDLKQADAPEDRSPFLLEEGDNVHEIFDHKPEAKLCLQVVMLYLDNILEVSHFRNKKQIVIGPKASDDFGVPPLLKGEASARYELLSKVGKGSSDDGANYLLNLHQDMAGVISQGGTFRPIKQVIAEAAGNKQLPLSEKDFAKITMGDVSFFVSFTPSPPRLKRQRLLARDPIFAKIWFTSLAATLLTVYGISKTVVNPNIEIEQLPERIATIIYKPELLPVEPKPKPPAPPPAPVEEKKPEPPKKEVIKVTPKEVTKPKPKDAVIGKEQPKEQKPKPQPAKPAQAAPKQPGPKANAAGNEGAGARAAGDNGTRGKPDAKPANIPQTKAQRPGSGPKNMPANARPGNSQVQDLGVVDVFKSSGGQLSKILAGGKGASGAADKLEGYGGFTTRGAGGLGDAGTGAGGGGQSMGLGGLADKGAGGGRKGTGLGALGSGGNIIGGSGKLVVAGVNGAPEPIVLGAIDSDAIARAVAEHRDEIKYCYEKEINAENPDLAGRVSVRWVIGASGQVTSAGVASTSLRNAAVESCVVAVIKRIAFPPVKGGGVAEVTYPFVFRPSDR
jgi:TonB family protein